MPEGRTSESLLLMPRLRMCASQAEQGRQLLGKKPLEVTVAVFLEEVVCVYTGTLKCARDVGNVKWKQARKNR